ncbi:hypothetical protein [Pontimicrobium aquaticum]|uniref:Uncharacterized protein n=1 Tax=Pontimicrobium aquaticum TaxID=2565367 RepID=A0A4U0EYE9_9FLAO|nr:hypothetical protein [Pontimicrobium aquaticum]TJY36950.1 hypothetical protein E5167_03120 [Pontimicrobium aquaticum]
MKYVRYISILISFTLFGQQNISTKLISKQTLDDSTLISIDKFNTHYNLNNTTLFLKGSKGRFEYTNLQLGDITSANTFNPLKINLFYKSFNTVIILDNRLSDIKKIDFNLLSPLRIVSKVSSANDNSIWIFNSNTQQLELFNFITNKTKHITLPTEGNILDLKSNYNFCWLLTDAFIYTYNYFGSLVSKLPNNGFEELAESNGNIILKRGNNLFYLNRDSKKTLPISLPNLLINRFFVTDETLYIYNGEMLHQYQLIND